MSGYVGALIKRFTDQLPINTGLQTVESMQILEQNKQCLVNVSHHKFTEIIAGLSDTWKSVEQTKETAEKLPTGEKNYRASLFIIMQTLELCLLRAPPVARTENEANIVNQLLPLLLSFLNAPCDLSSSHELKHQSERVIAALSQAHFKAIFSKVTRRLQIIMTSNDDNPDMQDINLLQHLNIDLSRLVNILSAVVSHCRNPKKALCLALATNLEKVIWNFMDTDYEQFTALQTKPDDNLAELCDKLFDIFSSFAESSQKRKASVWPLMIMLLVITPKFLEEITNAEGGAPCGQQHLKKKQFVEELRRAVSSANATKPNQVLVEGAVVTCVRMCKASTYIKTADSSNILIVLVKSVNNDLKNALFNPQRGFKTNLQREDIELMIDCFVAFYRISPYSTEMLKTCLNSSNPTYYHYVLVSGLLQIINQEKRTWWPSITIMYSRGEELRKMFSDYMTNVTQMWNTVRPTQPPAALMQKVLKPKEKFEDAISPKQLLYQIVQLINADPRIMLYSPEGSTSKDRHEAASDLINHLVTLITTMPDLASEAMEALLRLHQPEVIEMWNKDDCKDVTIQSFWDINSRVLYNISQKLILHQLPNYTEILKWLRDLLACRNKFLSRHKDSANVGSSNKVCKQAHIKLEVVLFMYLWSIDIEAVLTAMSCFEFMCEEADILYSGDEQVIHLHLPNYAVYQEIARSYKDLTTGRAALQKRIMPMLRKIEEPTQGNKQAWSTTFRKIWTKATDFLQSYSNKGDGGVTVKKRASNQTSDYELEDQLHEWINMTGFLCALGGVCLTKSDRSADNQYCPVTEYIGNLLKLLMCNNEKFGASIQRHVKDLVANELSPAIYPILFEQVKLTVDEFFDDITNQVIVKEINTQYIENVIFIMKMIFENYDSEQGGEHLGQASIEPLMLAIVRYVRYLNNEQDDVKIKTKLCNLVQAMMKRRDDLTFRQEMKFRNKLVEYLTEWIMGKDHNPAHHGRSHDLMSSSRTLDMASMEAVAALLKALPLQPEESDRGDLMEAKSELFLRYFTLFMKLLNECSEELEGSKEKGQVTGLRNVTVQAMSNLLSANIDSGLMHSITLGYHKDAQTKAAFMEVLTKILQQGTEFETLAETALADRYDRLVELVTMIGDKGELPIAMALANVVDNQHLDELARVLVTLFDAKHLLYQLLGNMFSKEVESDCMQTLFRGNNLSSKIMSFCFKLYGQRYLIELFSPHLEKMFDDDQRGVSYEVDPRRLEGSSGNIQEILAENRKNLLLLTQSIFNSIVNSAEHFPAQLKNMLFYLSQVVNTRYPEESIFAVGTVVFLRFINPALVSAKEFGLCLMEPTMKMKRGLTLVCKIMQNIANRVEREKETYMRYFSDFFKTNSESALRFFRAIATEVDNCETTLQLQCYFNDSTSVALHRLLWVYQEKIGEFLASSRDQKAAGRRPFDKMATLLAYLGPPEHRPTDSDWSAMYMEMSGSKFEEHMSKQNMHEKDEYKSLKSLRIFYQSGVSRAGNPVFYYVARKFRLMEINGDLLIYHVLLTLKPFQHKSFELVIDFTHTNAENRFRTHFLSHWFYVMNDTVSRNLHQVYIYNCNTWIKEYTKYHDRQFFKLKGNPKLVFIDQRSQLSYYIEPDQQNLPASTISLEEDLRVFQNGVKLSFRDAKCSIKIGQSAVQITLSDKSKVLGHQALLNDVYYVSEIKEISLVEDTTFTITISSESGPLQFLHADSETIVAALNHIKHRYQLTQPESYTPHTKIRPKDVPGTLLNVALLNLGSSDPSLRSAAYNLLCVLTQTFDLKIDDQLLETSGLCIPSNNTLFIKHISEKLAANVTRLTLEFLEECIQGCRTSSIEMKHLCLEYMTPWLPNLAKFCKHQDENKRQKVMLILDKLITLTIEEVKMYPSVQAKIWGNIGSVKELIDMVLDSFIKRSVTGGFGSRPADIMADTSVALASANVALVSRKVVSRILHMIEKTCTSPTPTLETHLMWNDIAILARYLLMLSFNNSLDVASHLPFLFHIVTLLVGLGPVSMKASTHGLVINIIHSLCTCSQLKFSEDTFRQLKLNLTEFSLPKFYNLFGISKVKSAAVSAFRSSYKPTDRHTLTISPDDESVPLTSLEVITDALLEIMEVCTAATGKNEWLQQWLDLAKRFAFQHNPALQPRSIVVFGCISKSISEAEIKQLLRILKKALESEGVLIEGVVMCLTRLQPLLRQDSVIHKYLFWVAIAILQLEDQRLYSAALAMLEQNLLTLDSHGVFETETLMNCMMETRRKLEWHFKQIDHQVEINFESNFHFALVAHLIKGFRHAETTTVSRTVRVLNLCHSIISKNLPDKYTVTTDTIPYLTALLPMSEEVRARCHHSPVVTTTNTYLDRFDVFASPHPDSRRPYVGATGPSPDPSIRSLPGSRKHWKSLDEVGTTNMHPTVTGRSASYNVTTTLPKHTAFIKGSVDNLFAKRLSTLITHDTPPPVTRAERSSRTSTSNENNILLDPEVLDEEIMVLVITVMATLVSYTPDDLEKRVLYQYLAEASDKFPKVFPVVCCGLLDAKINEHLRYSHDQEMLSALQTMIQNMLTIDELQQQKQLIILQNLGFAGISRFAGPFKIKPVPEKRIRDDQAITTNLRSYNGLEAGMWPGSGQQSNFSGAENLANCLEDMVENFLPGEDREFDLSNPYPSCLGISTSLSLSSLGTPGSDSTLSYRSRHSSHQQRRASLHRKSRKHSGSFE